VSRTQSFTVLLGVWIWIPELYLAGLEQPILLRFSRQQAESTKGGRNSMVQQKKETSEEATARVGSGCKMHQ